MCSKFFLVKADEKFSFFLHLLDIKTTQTTANDLIAKIADQLVLSCDITGFPVPAISWHKDGTKLPDASNKLSVKFHDDTHFGTYLCKGVNEAGEQKIKFSVVKTCK